MEDQVLESLRRLGELAALRAEVERLKAANAELASLCQAAASEFDLTARAIRPHNETGAHHFDLLADRCRKVVADAR